MVCCDKFCADFSFFLRLIIHSPFLLTLFPLCKKSSVSQMSSFLSKEYFLSCLCTPETQVFLTVFLGSSDSISCHYSPPRDQEWAIIDGVQLLWPPDTKKVDETMWSHPLSRVFLGLLALFYHNLALGDCIDGVLLTNLKLFCFLVVHI